MNDLVLALDIGTSSSRAIAFDSSGRAVDHLRAQVHYEPRTEPPGASEFDANVLVDSIAGCIDTVVQHLDSNQDRILAVGVCTFWHSAVGVNSDGKAVTPLYTWADTRASGAAITLAGIFDRNEYHARTGCAVHPSYLPARLLWLHDTDPELFKRVDQWISPGEFLFLRLFGEAKCTVSMASATGLFDQNRCDWDSTTLDVLPIDKSNLSPIVDIDAPSRGLAGEWAKRWPVLADLPWVPAIGDGASSNLGSGCDTDRRIAINLGTSGAIRVLWEADHVEIPPDLWCYRLDRKRLVMGGAFSDGGSVYAWMRDMLKLPESDDEIEALLRGREPFQHGLSFLPFLSGERSTGWRPDARGALNGLRISTEPLDVLQAGMEGVALRFSLVAESLRRIFPHANEIRASGGALGRSPSWAQMIADAVGRPITVAAESEASSRGAALVALAVVGLATDSLHTPVRPGRVFEPDPGRHIRYREALRIQQDLYARLAGIEVV